VNAIWTRDIRGLFDRHVLTLFALFAVVRWNRFLHDWCSKRCFQSSSWPLKISRAPCPKDWATGRRHQRSQQSKRGSEKKGSTRPNSETEGCCVSPTLFSDFQRASFINYTARDSVCVGAIGHKRLRGAFTGCCTYYHSPSYIPRPLEAVISCSILADDEIEKLS
jgi:hypothetical protein